MKISFEIKRICRAAGGLFLGLRYQFPVHILDTEDFPNHVATNTTYFSSILSIGLLFWQIDVEFKYGIEPIIDKE